MEKSDIQDLIDRLEALKKRQVELIDEQIELTKKVAEAVSQNDQGREFQAGLRGQTRRDRDAGRKKRRDSE